MPTVLMIEYAYPGFVRGFEARGWRVLRPDDANWYAWAHGNLAHVPRGPAAAYGARLRELCRRERPDLVVLAKALDSNVPAPDQDPPWWHVRAEDADATRADAAVLYLDLDAPDSTGWVISAGLHQAADAVGNCCVGTRDVYRHHGQPDLFEFWPAWDQAARAPGDPAADRPVDLVLVGTPYLVPNPGFGLPRRDVARAALELGLAVEVYGPTDWLVEARGGDPALAPVYRGVIPHERAHEVFALAKVGYSSFLRRGFRYLNDRVPMIAGAGAFCLMEEQVGLEAEFPEGDMVGYHRRANLDSFRARLAWWVGHPEERVRAAARMQAHVLAHHTWDHRAAAVISEYEGATARRRARRKACCTGG